MGERAVLQIGDDLFDDRVTPVIPLSVEPWQGRVGEHGMVTPDPEQLALRVALNVLGVSDPAPVARSTAPAPAGPSAWT